MLNYYTTYAIEVITLNNIDDLWEEGIESLVAGIMAGYKMCSSSTIINPKDISISHDALESISTSFKYPCSMLELKFSPVLRIKKGKWICLSGAALICLNVKKMAGLGDNISGAGFIYHYMDHGDNN